MFAVTAALVVIAAGVIVSVPHDRTPNAGVRRLVPDRRPIVPPVGRAALARRAGSPAQTARVATVAYRFAVAWRAWDSGRRSPRAAAVLRRSSVAAVWRRMLRERGRPTATRPPHTGALQHVRAVRTGPATWRAVIVARHPPAAYLATLVLIATASGPRVADVEP
jgi:hypothetical protein